MISSKCNNCGAHTYNGIVAEDYGYSAIIDHQLNYIEKQRKTIYHFVKIDRVIDLNILYKDCLVLAYLENGKDLRWLFSLDEIDKGNEVYRVIFPDSLASLNSSFFRGMFYESLKSLGEVGFRDKYKFTSNDVTRVDIEEGIRYCVINLARLC